MMGVYLFGYTLGFVSGALAYHWWLLGKEKIREGDEVILCGYEVIPRRNVDGSMTAYVQHKDGKESSFNYPAHEAQNMTVAKLEKKVKQHLKKEGYI